MKKILALSLLLLSSLTFGATLNPIQLLNPVGSTSGQVIASTGPTTAPAWTTVTLSGLPGTVAIASGGTGQTTQAAALTALLGSSTVPLANGGTGATTAANARTNLGLGTAATVNTGTSGATIPLLNGANTWAAAQTFSVRPTFNGATPWDSSNLASPALTNGNLSQFASTTSAQLATLLSDETGSGSAVFSLTPTLTAPNVVGTISGGNAATGSVGEYLTATNTATALTTATVANCTSLSLTAGDWDVQAIVLFTPASTTSVTSYFSGASSTSATIGAFGSYSKQGAAAQVPNNNSIITSPLVRISISSTTTVYAVGRADFTVSTMTCDGLIRARRVR
jgi:hypothetical protein